jgi:para-aminobenzoate synthetase component 1
MRAPLAPWVDPAVAFAALAQNEPRAIWLDAGESATTGRSYVSVPSGENLTSRGADETPEAFLGRLRAGLSEGSEIDFSLVHAGEFALGWVGWFGYEFGALAMGVPTAETPQVETEPADAVFMWVDWVLVWDHAAKTLDLLVLGEHEWELTERERAVNHALAQGAVRDGASAPQSSVSPPVVWRHGPDEYEALVRQCLEAIRAGDAYQLCLTNQVRVAGTFDPLSVYLRLRAENPSHHGALVRVGDVALLSSTPEVFLRVERNRRVSTKPIKGTRPRSELAPLDAALASELLDSDKERAENLMIVDLMRNDLGRVAALGSVRVDALLEVESYATVHQLVSTVSATLAPGLDALDALAACFPAGSMTGAPKRSAMTLLHSWERGPRGVYSGAFGYLGLDGACDLAMVIRSIVLDARGASVGTGGGITSGSVPSAELAETRLKVAPLLRALGVDAN